ncbi:MAG: hypothetical protein CL946_08505 [Ectothiorhodospiraceae bacterium]|nr:hypothetical protein [Ectothiorhodospiraceae bacterium]
MSESNIEQLFLAPESSIRLAMQTITDAPKHGLPSGIGLVVDGNGALLGVVTDGDLRRALLSGTSMDGTLKDIYTKDPIVFNADMSNAQILDEIPQRLRDMGRYRGGVLEKIILVDASNKVESVIDFVELWKSERALAKNVSVVGLGYVGLTLAVVLSDIGFDVTGIEKNSDIRSMLESGKPHFHEVGLQPMLQHHLGTNFRIHSAPLSESEVYILAVATPVQQDHKPSLTYLEQATRQVGKVLSYGDLVVIRSTVPLGTCRNVVIPLLEEESGLKCGRDFSFAFAPERTIEGKALQELRTLPQVIGGFDDNSVQKATSLFREMSPNTISVGSLEAAEMVKLVNNTFRDVKFAFANELATLCERYNLDTVEIIRAANEGYPRDPVPIPSPGVGGACLKKDPYIFAQAAIQAEIPDTISLLARKVNEYMPELVAAKLLRAIERQGKNPTECKLFLIGFAFKGEPETSDMRNSTSLDVLKALSGKVKEIRGYDPVVSREEIEAEGVVFQEIEEGFRGADCVAVLNNHRSYANIDIFRCLKSMNRPAVYGDFWYIFTPDEIMQIEQISYVGLGFQV